MRNAPTGRAPGAAVTVRCGAGADRTQVDPAPRHDDGCVDGFEGLLAGQVDAVVVVAGRGADDVVRELVAVLAAPVQRLAEPEREPLRVAPINRAIIVEAFATALTSVDRTDTGSVADPQRSATGLAFPAST
ncbi:hypothetical protein GCM10007967_31300 [Xylanimonas ulmi]